MVVGCFEGGFESWSGIWNLESGSWKLGVLMMELDIQKVRHRRDFIVLI